MGLCPFRRPGSPTACAYPDADGETGGMRPAAPSADRDGAPPEIQGLIEVEEAVATATAALPAPVVVIVVPVVVVIAAWGAVIPVIVTVAAAGMGAAGEPVEQAAQAGS